MRAFHIFVLVAASQAFLIGAHRDAGTVQISLHAGPKSATTFVKQNSHQNSKVSTGNCETDRLGVTIPAYRGGISADGCLSKLCVNGSTSFGKNAIKAGVQSAAGLNPFVALFKAAIYGGLKFSGAMMDPTVDAICRATVASIVVSCPRGEGKSRCPLGTSTRNRHCKDVYRAVQRGDKGDFKCAVTDWWDACCYVREEPEDDEAPCSGCGQDKYFCTEIEGV